MKPDLKISGGGTIYLVSPVSKAGQEWLDETAPAEAQFLGNSMAVEHRYIAEVVEIARAMGMKVT
jgi:hypothetical protein